MNRLKADWISGVLIGIFLTMQGIAMYFARGIVNSVSSASGGSTASTAPTQETAPLAAGEIILIAAVEIAVILLLYRGYQRLPEKWQYRIRKGLKWSVFGLLYLLGLFVAWLTGNSIQYVVGVPLAYGLYRVFKDVLSANGLKWIAFNLIAVSMGTGIVLVGGLNLSPMLVIVIMVAFLIYDHVAVHLTNIMSNFVAMSSATRFPNFLIVPTQLRIDLERVHEYIQGKKDEKPEELAVMIGLGDFIFPSILVVSVFVAADASLTAPVVTTIGGLCLSVFVLRASLERAESGLPALPYLNSGAIIGYVIGVAVLMVA